MIFVVVQELMRNQAMTMRTLQRASDLEKSHQVCIICCANVIMLNTAFLDGENKTGLYLNRNLMAALGRQTPKGGRPTES